MATKAKAKRTKATKRQPMDPDAILEQFKLGNRPQEELWNMPSGVKLKIKRVGFFLINAASRHIEKPEVPKQFIEDKGREEENPMDPAYQDALREWAAQKSEAVQDVLLLKGTEIVDIPEGMEGPDGDEWVADMRFLGIGISDDKRERYLQWMRLVAMRGEMDDYAEFMARIGRLNGVTEADVAEAAANFRGETIRE